jgi:hypothetical protein
MTDFRALCEELADELTQFNTWYIEDNGYGLPNLEALLRRCDAALAQPEPQGPTDEELMALAVAVFEDPFSTDKDYARAVLARWGRPAIEPDGPAVPDGREPASVTDQPTDKELLELMPETMRDEFSYAARTCSDAMGGRVKPGIFRVALNTAALEYAQAVLARWGTANNTINQED